MRITRQIINYIKDLKKKHSKMFCVKHLTQEVEINGTGANKYRIKHGPNKGRVLWSQKL